MTPIRSLLVFDTAIDADAFCQVVQGTGVDTPCPHPGFLEDERMARALDKKQLLAHVRASTGKPVCFYVQAEALYRVGTLTVEQFDAELALARNGDPPPSWCSSTSSSPREGRVLRKHCAA